MGELPPTHLRMDSRPLPMSRVSVLPIFVFKKSKVSAFMSSV